MPVETSHSNVSATATTALVLGGVATLMALIPVVGLLSFLLAVPAFICGIIAMRSSKSRSTNWKMAVTAAFLSPVAMTLSIVTTIGLGVLLDSDYDSKTPMPASASSEVRDSASLNPNGITKAQYDKVTVGMTKAEVMAIVGKNGKVVYESEGSSGPYIVYDYPATSGYGHGEFTFRNGALRSKMQSSLKD